MLNEPTCSTSHWHTPTFTPAFHPLCITFPSPFHHQKCLKSHQKKSASLQLTILQKSSECRKQLNTKELTQTPPPAGSQTSSTPIEASCSGASEASLQNRCAMLQIQSFLLSKMMLFVNTFEPFTTLVSLSLINVLSALQTKSLLLQHLPTKSQRLLEGTGHHVGFRDTQSLFRRRKSLLNLSDKRQWIPRAFKTSSASTSKLPQFMRATAVKKKLFDQEAIKLQNKFAARKRRRDARAQKQEQEQAQAQVKMQAS